MFLTACGRKKDAPRNDFIESIAHHSRWSAKNSELPLGQERQFRGRVICALSFTEEGYGTRQCVWCLR